MIALLAAATQPVGSDDHDIKVWALTVAIVALCFTITNAGFSIFNVVMTRFRWIKVVIVNKTFQSGVRAMSFDVTCLGAPIHDLDMYLCVDTTGVVFRKLESGGINEPGLSPKSALPLARLYEVTNPINAGQSQVFEMYPGGLGSESDLEKNWHQWCVYNSLVKVGDGAVSVKIVCNGSRTTLRTYDGEEWKHKLLDFFKPEKPLPTRAELDVIEAAMKLEREQRDAEDELAKAKKLDPFKMHPE